ncbi:hypothetical protein O7627_26290 [Solwaraspora sp. WMMD1047]|uniref:hypothetical protein n=1 Tax=Solwaraspora sp. WMMD1047 TaxID=3016102 RepID=UPI002417EFE6|nr:hypothetical protein [Solwaraspora sp. WMMD1047]MDG4832788.1 hypothetical protein [Solwaraspora sp. WMMD1047]
MTDPYRVYDPTESTEPAADGQRRGGLIRPLLWTALVISAILNAATSLVNPYLGVGFGVLTLACIVALVVQHRRHRR